jgi:hypothetical protein
MALAPQTVQNGLNEPILALIEVVLLDCDPARPLSTCPTLRTTTVREWQTAFAKRTHPLPTRTESSQFPRLWSETPNHANLKR